MKELEDIVKRALAGPISEAEAEKLRNSLGSLAWLQQELASKNVTLSRLRSLFGLSTSEKTKKVVGGEAASGNESGASTKDEPPDGQGAAKAPPKEKRKGHGRRGAAEYTGAERIAVRLGTLSPGDPCPCCAPAQQGKLYAQKPKPLVRLVGQAPLKATVYEREKLRCNLCGKLFTADPPPEAGEEKYDVTAAAMVALLKYGTGVPFHRLERLEGNLGIPLPAGTQWEIVRGAAEGLAPVHEELIRQGAQGRVLHNDDTSMEVLELRKEIKELEKLGEADRTGIFSTGIVSELEDGRRVALFFTGRQHAGENMADVLRRRASERDPPMQMCDGQDRNLPKDFETVLANCLAHGRRKFVEVYESFPEQCRFVLETLGKVYKNDAIAREEKLSDEERLEYHEAHSGPLMDKLEAWMREQIDEKQVEPNSSLGGAIAYVQKRWQQLTLFLREPGAPLDNNICERALKKAILHRRNSLFYKTENGARVGDLFMSLIHTADLAGENAFDYLTALLGHLSEIARDPAAWLPWNYRATLAGTAGAASAA
jgi:transposase